MTTKVHLIKAVLNFRTMTPDVVFRTANAVLLGVYHNPNFAGVPAPPVDEPTPQAANGGKKEMEQQKKDKEVVVKILIHFLRNCFKRLVKPNGRTAWQQLDSGRVAERCGTSDWPRWRDLPGGWLPLNLQILERFLD